MTIMSFLPRVKQIVSTGGSGNLVLGAAASGFQALGAGQNAAQLPYYIEDGTAWEEGTLVYTHSGTTVARTFKASSTGSALTVSVGAYVYIGMTADLAAAHDLAMQTYITGCVPSKGSGNTANITAGALYDPSSGKVISVPAATNLALGTLGASQWNQIFRDSSGWEITNNSDPPSTPYSGNARKGGTGGNKRWVCSILTDSSSNVISFGSVEPSGGMLEVQFNIDNNLGPPSRIVSAGASTSVFVQASAAGIVPRYAAIGAFMTIYVTADPAGSGVGLSTDGATVNVGIPQAPGSSGGFGASVVWSPLERSTPSIYYKTSVGSTTTISTYIDISMYRIAR